MSPVELGLKHDQSGVVSDFWGRRRSIHAAPAISVRQAGSGTAAVASWMDGSHVPPSDQLVKDVAVMAVVTPDVPAALTGPHIVELPTPQ